MNNVLKGAVYAPVCRRHDKSYVRRYCTVRKIIILSVGALTVVSIPRRYVDAQLH